MPTQLDRMEAKLNELIAWKARMEERCKNHLLQTAELSKILFANPGGLRAKVERLWNCKKDSSAQRTLIRGFVMGVFKIVVAALILGIIGWFLYLYKKG